MTWRQEDRGDCPATVLAATLKTRSEVTPMTREVGLTASRSETADGNTSRVVDKAAGASLGAAVVTRDGDVVQIRFQIASGHLPTTARHDLVAAVFALPELENPGIVQAAIPIGDADLLAELRAHLADVHTRAAGATCLIDATTES